MLDLDNQRNLEYKEIIPIPQNEKNAIMQFLTDNDYIINNPIYGTEYESSYRELVLSHGAEASILMTPVDKYLIRNQVSTLKVNSLMTVDKWSLVNSLNISAKVFAVIDRNKFLVEKINSISHLNYKGDTESLFQSFLNDFFTLYKHGILLGDLQEENIYVSDGKLKVLDLGCFRSIPVQGKVEKPEPIYKFIEILGVDKVVHAWQRKAYDSVASRDEYLRIMFRNTDVNNLKSREQSTVSTNPLD